MTQPVHVPNADDMLFGGGAPSISLKTIGEFVEGPVVDKGVVHKTKFGTQDKEYYKDGNPIWQLVLSIQTNLRDPERHGDDGVRRIFASPQLKVEIAKALKSANMTSLPLGARLRITFVREVPSAGGGSPKKEYSVVFTAPADAAIAESIPVTPVQVAAPVQAANPLAGLSPELLAALAAQMK